MIFQSLFASVPSKPGIGGYVDSGIDFTKEDELFPRVSVVNPSESAYAQIKEFLDFAYDKAKTNYEKAKA